MEVPASVSLSDSLTTGGWLKNESATPMSASKNVGRLRVERNELNEHRKWTPHCPGSAIAGAAINRTDQYQHHPYTLL